MARLVVLLGAALLCALLTRTPEFQQAPSAATWAEGSPDLWPSAGIAPSAFPAGTSFMCPMDRDISSKTPGFCPRCGMKLVAGIPDAKEYAVHIAAQPPGFRPGENVQLTFRIEDPKTKALVRDFEIVHEKLYHLFVVSQDLAFFLHTHPEPQPDRTFRLDVRLPKPGMYRVLSDFYPKDGTPQLVVNTLIARGGLLPSEPAKLVPDVSPQHAANVQAELVMPAGGAVAGAKTPMYVRLTPNEGIEPYLGAMAHLLAASADLIDLIHSHPIQSSDIGARFKQLQFDLTFPRPGIYRVWVQTQRKGLVNTVAFNVPVSER